MGRDAIAFAAEQHYAAAPERGVVDIAAFEECAPNREARGEGLEERGQACLTEIEVSDGSHRGLDDLRRVRVGAGGREDHAVDAKPIGQAEYGAHVTGVLDAVEGKDECGWAYRQRGRLPGAAKEGYCLVGSGEMGEAGEFGGAHGDDFGLSRGKRLRRGGPYKDGLKARQELSYESRSFGEKEAELVALRLACEAFAEVYVAFANHLLL